MDFQFDRLSLMGRGVAFLTGTEMGSESHNFWMDFWLLRLMCNLFAYATVALPLVLVVQYYRMRGLFRKPEALWASSSILDRFLAALVVGRPRPSSPETPSENGLKSGKVLSIAEDPQLTKSQQAQRRFLLLLFCTSGLQCSYVVWGIMQEKIMTLPYRSGSPSIDSTQSLNISSTSSDQHKFKDSQFLVFMNRIAALTVSSVYIYIYRDSLPIHTAPFYKYSFASFSNIMSAWCQYEALKFISFPTQVLGKASKIIPVMLMGRLVMRRTYPFHQYATALLLSIGMSLFLLSRSTATEHPTKVSLSETGKPDVGQSLTLVSGLILLIGYLTFDAFTSNWQSNLFQTYKMSNMHMMLGVNTFSSLFTLVGLLEHGGLVDSVHFLFSHRQFAFDVLLLSSCGAVGQLFIFFTIKEFGPVTFTIIMTVRMGFSIILSCIIYGHKLKPLAIVGVALVFVSIFARIWLNERQKKAQAKASRLSSQQLQV